MMDRCKLCHEKAELRASHIIPKFVFRWMAQTGDGYFRGGDEPNLRVQDGPKKRLLCGDCEQRFSIREKWFAETVFTPYIERGAKHFTYDASLFYFAVSLSWRILIQGLQSLHQRLAHFRPLLEACEQEWRSYLLGGPVPPRYSEVHVFITDIGLIGGEQPVEGFNSYMARAVDGDVIGSRSGCSIYSKIARFIFFGAITPTQQTDSDKTLICPAGGILEIPQRLSDGDLGEFLVDRARMVRERIFGELSPLQQKKIGERALKVIPKIANSDLVRAIQADSDAAVVPFLSGKIGRNEMCPCGSLKKYKKCHGSK
jgi:hypothetical protein